MNSLSYKLQGNKTRNFIQTRGFIGFQGSMKTASYIVTAGNLEGQIISPVPPDNELPQASDDNAHTPTWDTNTPHTTSTTFYPDAIINSDVSTRKTDLMILSEDRISYFVQCSRLLSASNNNFNHLLPSAESVIVDGSSYCILRVPEKSTVFNIVLHAAYGASCRHSNPNLQSLSSALSGLQKYGFSLRDHITASSSLFGVLMLHATQSPLELYTLAASRGLEELAVAASFHLLSFPLSCITDECAVEMGPLYLKRLFLLHTSREEALVKLLDETPEIHNPTPTCGAEEESSLKRAWTLATARFVLEDYMDIPTVSKEMTKTPLSEHLTCDLCKTALNNRFMLFLSQWNVVKRTI